MLEVKGISKHFNGVQAVDDISFHIEKGTITSLIGPNGAGKTTLFNIICGYIESDKGYAVFEGEELNGSAPHAIASLGLGRTFQNLRIIGKISTLDNVMLAFGNQRKGGFLGALTRSISRKEEAKNRSKAFERLEFVGLTEKADEPAESLSYGQQKLLSLACCLALDAKLLMLDEPVAGVNQETIARILSLLAKLRDGGHTIFLIEHNLDAVMKVSDRLIVMDEGRIIADGVPSVVKENPAVIDAYLS
jgi:branched-chain amino acid transport system ATP-binding protein